MSDSPRTLSVTGTGTAESAPDLLTLTIGVESRRPGVEAAYRDAGAAATAITDALRGHGVKDGDITGTGLSLRAEVTWQEGQGQRVTGYLATGTLRVRLRDLAGSASVISDAVRAGTDDARLHGIGLGFADPAALESAARQAAWEDALTRAGQFAALAGARLGKVLSVTENPASPPALPPVPLQRTAAAQPVAVEAGSVAVTAAVGVVWELLD
ncbi:SIMPL domain-containing protein [Arthrobacter sp. 1P04PC]|uniref:SIMPL domain-containing protein n=1 Tax=unclassified Arthrobacter TaxID=235627 RepID=UPI00399FACA3